jgi:hypothetical protein
MSKLRLTPQLVHAAVKNYLDVTLPPNSNPRNPSRFSKNLWPNVPTTNSRNSNPISLKSTFSPKTDSNSTLTPTRLYSPSWTTNSSPKASTSLRKVKSLIKSHIFPGTIGFKFYIILEGKAEVYVAKRRAENHDPEAEEIKMREIGNGDSFGELALLDKHVQPRSASVLCVEACHFAVLSRKNFGTL